MSLYLPTATMAPCTLAEAPSGSVFLQIGGGILLVGEVDQHDIAVRVSGDEAFTAVPFSRDERSNVRGIVAGQVLFEADAETAYRVRDANYAAGDIVLGKGSTSIIGMHEDGGAFEVTILGDPQRGPAAGFTAWRLGSPGGTAGSASCSTAARPAGTRRPTATGRVGRRAGCERRPTPNSSSRA